jgi:hypothetical protein
MLAISLTRCTDPVMQSAYLLLCRGEGRTESQTIFDRRVISLDCQNCRLPSRGKSADGVVSIGLGSWVHPKLYLRFWEGFASRSGKDVAMSLRQLSRKGSDGSKRIDSANAVYSGPFKMYTTAIHAISNY